MKILFLQNCPDVIGGVEFVNKTLAEGFTKRGHEIAIFSLRLCGKNENINLSPKIKTKLINDKTKYAPYSRRLALEYFLKFKFIKCINQVVNITEYKIGLKKDFRKFKKEIVSYAPNLIIVSYTYLLDAIPKTMLDITVANIGTSFEFHKNNRFFYKKLNKYKNKIHKISWPTRATSDLAVKDGLSKSVYIYNPLKFSSGVITDYNQKKAIYIGRISPEKQVDLIIKMFNEVIEENNIHDWSLDVFGSGELSRESLKTIKNNPNISYKGSTLTPEKELLKASIFMLASKYEAFCLSLFEANECGLPAIAFEFGEPTEEAIINNETGFIIDKNDIEPYKQKLCKLMNDAKLRQRLGKNAKEHAKQANIETVLDTWEEKVLIPVKTRQ